MLDRYIGFAGLILGILAFIAPYRWPSMSPIITSAGLYVAILLIGVALGIFCNENYWRPTTEQTASSTSLFLQFSDDHTTPKEVRQTNVLSWYALYTESIYVDTLDKDKKSIGGFSVPPRWSIFILFKNPATYRQLLATCSGSENLKCNVQFSNDRYAIITAIGNVAHSTLDVSTVPLYE